MAKKIKVPTEAVAETPIVIQESSNGVGFITGLLCLAIVVGTTLALLFWNSPSKSPQESSLGNSTNITVDAPEIKVPDSITISTPANSTPVQ